MANFKTFVPPNYFELIETLSIIIPVYKNINGLQKVVLAIKLSEISIDYEIIVCNDGADNSISNWLNSQKIKEVKINRRNGSYYARNRGIEAAKANHLLFVDADVSIKYGWFKLLLESIERYDYIAFSINIAIDENTPLLKRYSKFVEFNCQDYWEKNHFGPTAFLYVNKRIFDETGGFDEKQFSGGDLELGNRCWHANYKMKFITNNYIFHEPRNIMAKYYTQVRILQGIIQLKKEYPNRLMDLPEINFKEWLKSPFKFIYSIIYLKRLKAYKDPNWSIFQIIWAEYWHKKMYAFALLKVLTTKKIRLD